MKAFGFRWMAGWVLSLVALSAPARGQVILGSISGVITDTTGAALPGVTVTVTSPALQVAQMVRTSEAGGEYQIPDLPPGMYRMAYELPGFTTVVRQDIVISSGFN